MVNRCCPINLPVQCLMNIFFFFLRLRRLVFVNWCIMCCHCGETVDHLFLHCEMAYRLWSFVFITIGLSWVIPRSIPDQLFGWWNWLGKHSSQIWNLVPLCILWCIWKERNRRTFKDLDSSNDQMLASFSGTLFDWSRAWRLTSSDSLPSFLCSPFSFVIFLLFGFLLCFSLFSISCIFQVCSMFFMHRVAFHIYIILTYQKIYIY